VYLYSALFVVPHTEGAQVGYINFTILDQYVAACGK